MSEQPAEATRILLTGLIDYAGLFPPAALPMPEAVINYATYCNSNYSWMLGRFVVPVSRLAEFTDAAQEFFARDKNCWRLSVLASEDIEDTVRQVKDFNQTHAPLAVCDSIEVKANTSSLIEKIVPFVPPQVTAYFEVPLGENLPDLIATLSVHKQRAKIRTGGVTTDAFPSAEQITRFMRICSGANVPFKATAGLHHPVRCAKPLTYDKDAPVGTMHGFLNVFLAAAFLRQGFKSRLIQEILEDDWAESFTFENDGILWRQEHFLSLVQIQELRQKYAISFGSCSFVEPISDLQEIDLL